MPSFFSHISVRNRIIALVGIAVVVLGTILYFASRSSSHFAQEFAAYEQLAQAQGTAAYVPAAPDNTVREQLNAALSLALQPTTKAADRLKYAQQGLDLITQLNAQIDAIADAGQKADTMVAQMQVESLKDFSTSGETTKLIDLTKQRSAIIEDIRGLSYRADFETQQIFQQLIVDDGKLSNSYVNQLNAEIPDVETQFDHRSSLYQQLTAISSQIDQKAGQLHLAIPQ